MFEAYSQSKGKIVNVKDEFDLNEIFLCPNPQCGAKLTLRSVNGKMAKHFARLRSSQHIEGCPYNNGQQGYVDSEDMIKYSLEDIYSSQSHLRGKDLPHSKTPTNKDYVHIDKVEPKFIRTPKQLYYFCINNALDTPYTDNLTVGDIVLDSRNLQYNANFRGISGLRLVIAETIKYDFHEKYIKLRLYQRTIHNKFLNLTVTVYLERNLIENAIDYIIKTHGRFGGYHVAILGNWSIDEEYHISCTLNDKNHLLLKL